ncbi:MAG TPA: nucleotidyltransferase family protein [Patescibacteria group bacterium]|nr:nucleotidyltransferase family protein [Patescibacteria group bacterium]
MAPVPKKAFVLAAGLGERMRPLTNTCPKPLLYVGGRTMLDRALDALEEAGVEEVMVNTHYLPQMIEDHLKTRQSPKITVTREEELLDTGGGVKRMLDWFGDAPFYVLNADVVWTDGDSGSTLRDMAAQWDENKMDLLLLLHTTQDLPLYNGRGDYYLAEESDQPVFKERAGRPANYIFAGPRIVHPRLFKGAREGGFSFLELFHKAEEAGRLYAHRHGGDWHHVGTPEALEETNRILEAKAKKRAP